MTTRNLLNPLALLGLNPNPHDIVKSLADLWPLVNAEKATVTADYTTEGNAFEKVICNNTGTITVTLGAHQDSDKVLVIRGNTGAVSVSGSINGASSQSIANQYDALWLEYFEELDEWVIL